MSVITYKCTDDFLKENLNIMTKSESLSQLLLINVLNKKIQTSADDFLMGKVTNRNNDTALIFVNCLPFNLNIFSTDDTIDISAVKELAQYIGENNITIHGLNANKAICGIFANKYKSITGRLLTEHLAMDIMELRHLKDFKLPKGTFRKASVDDFSLLSKWTANFYLDALNEIIAEDVKVEKLNSLIKSNCLYLYIAENGQPVSMAAVTRKIVKGCSLGFVYTDPSNRGHGYGEAVVYNLSRLCLENGNEFCSLFVDKYNPISNKLYKKLGYKIIDNNYDYRFNN